MRITISSPHFTFTCGSLISSAAEISKYAAHFSTCSMVIPLFPLITRLRCPGSIPISNAICCLLMSCLLINCSTFLRTTFSKFFVIKHLLLKPKSNNRLGLSFLLASHQQFNPFKLALRMRCKSTLFFSYASCPIGTLSPPSCLSGKIPQSS